MRDVTPYIIFGIIDNFYGEGFMKDFDDNKFLTFILLILILTNIPESNEFMPLNKSREIKTLEELGYSFEVGV